MNVEPGAMGARLRAARTRLGLSQRALCAAADVSQSTIHRLETGVQTKATLADLDRLAIALGVTLEFLLYGVSVREEVRAAARCANGADVDQALEYGIALLELDDALDGIGSELRQERVHRLVTPMGSGTPKQAEDLAGQVRQVLGLSVAPISELDEVIEELTGVDVGAAPLPDGVSGVVLEHQRRDTALLIVNSDEVAHRQRFTMAHELGHLLFGDPAHVHTLTSFRSPAENRCDEFARTLLIPREGVRAWAERVYGPVKRPLIDTRHVALLARHFGVSPEVAAIQLDRMRLRRHRALPSGRTLAHRHGWGAQYDTEQAAARQPRPPRRLLDRAIEAYQSGNLGIGAIARLQCRSVAEVERELTEAGITAQPAVRRADMATLLARAATPPS
ncbi:MAG TPA: XRE family transcriptional regulator [Mycobacteriales bacterium]|nr:XRE family transcriptional regulator [Mycobacteriales bacterium]